MDPKRKRQLEIAALERDLKNAEEVLKKGYLRFVLPGTLIFTVFFTPLFGLIKTYGESAGNTLDDWLVYTLVGFLIGLLNSTVGFLRWRKTRNKNVRLLAQLKESGTVGS